MLATTSSVFGIRVTYLGDGHPGHHLHPRLARGALPVHMLPEVILGAGRVKADSESLVQHTACVALLKSYNRFTWERLGSAMRAMHFVMVSTPSIECSRPWTSRYLDGMRVGGVDCCSMTVPTVMLEVPTVKSGRVTTATDELLPNSVYE